MRISLFLLTACLLFGLSGCKVTGIKGEIGGVKVEAKENGEKNESGTFCPPGQAKKGNC
ncbi:MAG: hypothetical protein OEZ38_12165 [Gammaproteobacteria bacterium]|nr:hypothetical protein [Gammaproteobacteria bacterium]